LELPLKRTHTRSVIHITHMTTMMLRMQKLIMRRKVIGTPLVQSGVETIITPLVITIMRNGILKKQNTQLAMLNGLSDMLSTDTMTMTNTDRASDHGWLR
jgi:hypothetical protein